MIIAQGKAAEAATLGHSIQKISPLPIRWGEGRVRGHSCVWVSVRGYAAAKSARLKSQSEIHLPAPSPECPSIINHKS